MKNYWNLRLDSIGIIFYLLSTLTAYSQFSGPDTALPKSKERYLYPIKPGQPGSLAGNMGELRATHFHSGIDIRTDNKTGYPVFAAKSGYISRVSMSPSGYGNVLYITHPDGNTTLYAHLLQFKGPIAKFVLEEQYKAKKFDIDLMLQENQFTVAQGDTIALSGNTGSSGGPHVHFDIRDANNQALDPLEFGFHELFDNTPPMVEKIALITLDKDSRVNDRFGRFEFYAFRVGATYALRTPVYAYGNIAVELLAKDRFAPNSQFYGGVKFIEMRVDDHLVFSQTIDKVNLAETRSIFTLMNFKTMRTKGSRFYKLYIDDGNRLPYYGNLAANGKISVRPGKEVNVKLTLRDAFSNTSVMLFKLIPSPPTPEVKNLEPLKAEWVHDISENTLMLSTKSCPVPNGKSYLYAHGAATLMTPSYYNALQQVYLVDLRKTIPDSAVICGKTINFNLKAAIPPGTDYKYYGEWAEVNFPSSALYDTLYLATNYRTESNGTEIFSIGNRTIPLNNSLNVSLQPKVEYLKNKNPAVYRVSGKSYTYLGGTWSNGRINFTTRELGDFTVLYDVTPPAIKPVYIDSMSVSFKIRDDLSGIASYEAYINGEWLLMHFDDKSDTIWSERLDKKNPLKGKLEIFVTDQMGNRQAFNRYIP